MTKITRRSFIRTSVTAAVALPAGRIFAAVRPATDIPPTLRRRAMAALDRHPRLLRDRIGIADYAAPSRRQRFFIVDLASGREQALLVAHGRGSDPRHSGWLQHFSNAPGSAASSSGAYETANAYTGSHGASRRLHGLDPANHNAMDRAIVVHPAWYVSDEMVDTQGKLGRSEGCFAFSESDIATVLDRLGEGRLIYADKV